jgi:hypothetical protein
MALASEVREVLSGLQRRMLSNGGRLDGECGN